MGQVNQLLGQLGNLTLTSVVFEWEMVNKILILQFYLTLTSVVFESAGTTPAVLQKAI